MPTFLQFPRQYQSWPWHLRRTLRGTTMLADLCYATPRLRQDPPDGAVP